MKNTVLKNFVIFAGKHLLGSLFNKVVGLMACNFIKKRDPTAGVFLYI